MTKHATGCAGTASGCNGQTYLRCAQENGIDPAVWNRDSFRALKVRAARMSRFNVREYLQDQIDSNKTRSSNRS